MYDAYLNPKDVLRPTTVVPGAVQSIMLNPESTDLAHKLVAWVLGTAARASAAQRSPLGGKGA